MVPAAAPCVAPAPHSHRHRPCRSHTTTAGRSSCRVSWFMAVCRGSKLGESAPWFNCGAERRRQSGLDTNKREKNEKEEAGSSASRDSNRNKKKPGGGIEPPQRHQPRALSTGSARKFGEFQVCNSSSGVAWASPTCPNGGCGDEAASPEPGEFAPRGMRVPNSSWGDQSHPRALPRLPTRRVRWNGHTIVPA